MRDPFACVPIDPRMSILLVAVLAAVSAHLSVLLTGMIHAFAALGLVLFPPIVRRAADVPAAHRAVTRLQTEAITKGGTNWPAPRSTARRGRHLSQSARFRLARTTAPLETLSYLCGAVCGVYVIFVGD